MNNVCKLANLEINSIVKSVKFRKITLVLELGCRSCFCDFHPVDVFVGGVGNLCFTVLVRTRRGVHGVEQDVWVQNFIW